MNVFAYQIQRSRIADALAGLTDQQLCELYEDLDSREYSFTDQDVDTMTDIRAEQTKRRQQTNAVNTQQGFSQSS